MRTKEVRKTRIFMKIHQISNRLRHVGVSQNPEKSKIEFGGQKCVENPSEHDALSFRSIRGRESVEKSILVSLFSFFDHFPHIYMAFWGTIAIQNPYFWRILGWCKDRKIFKNVKIV